MKKKSIVPEQREESKTMTIEEAKKELHRIESRRPRAIEEKTACQKALLRAEKGLSARGIQARAAREERQEALANGVSPAKLNAKVRDLRLEDELVEDEVIGLRTKLARLDEEIPRLYGEANGLKQIILKEESARPLMEEYNDLARKMSDVLTGLHQTIVDFRKVAIPGKPAPLLFRRLYGQELPLILFPIAFPEDDPKQPLLWDWEALIRKSGGNIQQYE